MKCPVAPRLYGMPNTTGDELTRIRTSDEHHIPALVTTADEDPYGAPGVPVLDELMGDQEVAGADLPPPGPLQREVGDALEVRAHPAAGLIEELFAGRLR